MRLPQILAQADVPVPRAPGTGDASGVQLAAAEGISRVGRSVVGALGAISHAERHAEDERRKADEARLKQEVDIESKQLQSQAEMLITGFDSELRETVRDPDEYQKQWTAFVEQTRANILGSVAHPESVPELQKAWPGIQQRQFAKMLTAKHGLVVDRLRGNLATHLDTLKQLGGFEPLTDEGEANAGVHLANLRVAIDGARPLIGDKDADSLSIGERDAFLDERATRHAREDPIGFLAVAETSPLYRQLSPAKRTAHVHQAQQAAKQQRADGEKALQGAMATWKESIQRETGILLADRALTREWLDEHKHAFTDTEWSAYQKALDAQTHGGPAGNPAVMEQFTLDVYNTSTTRGDGRPTPEVVRDRLLFARKNGLVSDAKFTPWMTHLDAEIRRRTGETKGEQEKGETRIREFQERNFRLTMDNIDRTFRTTTFGEQLLGKFDPIVAQAAGLFREEVQRRSLFTGRGREEADAIYRERLPHYLATVESNAQARLAELERDLTLKTPQALRAAEAAMPKDKWIEQLRLFNEITAIRKELLLLKARAGQGTPDKTEKPPQTPSTNPRARQ